MAYIYVKWAPNANRQHSVIKHNVRNIEHKGDKRMCAMLYIQVKERHTKHEKKGGKKVSAYPQHYLVFHPDSYICLVLRKFLNKRDLLKAILRY